MNGKYVNEYALRRIKKFAEEGSTELLQEEFDNMPTLGKVGVSFVQVGRFAWSYSTAIQAVLPDGRIIGNTTWYSSTTKAHQNRLGVKDAQVVIDNVPRGTDDLVGFWIRKNPEAAKDMFKELASS